MTVFRSRYIKNGLRRFILFLDIGIVYTLIILEDLFKIIFSLLLFFAQRDKKGHFLIGNGDIDPNMCPVTSPLILEVVDVPTMIYFRPKLHLLMILRPAIYLENRLKVIFGYFLKNNGILTCFFWSTRPKKAIFKDIF